RVGFIDGQFIANPTTSQQAASSLELVVAGTEDAILMVESGANEVSEETMLDALAFGHRECQRLARAQKELVAQAGKPRWAFEDATARHAELATRVRQIAASKLADVFVGVHDKHARAEAVARVAEEVMQTVGGGDDTLKAAVREAFESVEKAEVRRLIVERGLRV